MSGTKLVIGLPAGSLADPNRGGSLMNLLRDAGFPAKGYDKGGPSTFPLSPFLLGWDGRPQEFGSQLALGEVDIAIGGDDWIRERQLEFQYEYNVDFQLERVLSLNRGKVRIVIIGRESLGEVSCDEWLGRMLDEKSLLTMVAEMPYLAIDWFQKKIEKLGFSESHGQWSIQKFKTPPRIDRGLVIYETWGKSEAKVVNEAVDFGIEITQTGSAIRNYGLHILDTIMESGAGVWINKTLRDNPEKRELARMFLLNLHGSIHAENKVMVLFNVPRNRAEETIAYLRDNHLFADEPTIIMGEGFAEFSIQLDATKRDLPLAKVRYELARMGATGINTIPLESSIPGFDAIDI